MARILVVYASKHGHTRKVADRIAGMLRAEGRSADLADASTPLERTIMGYGAYILASSVNYGKHQPAMVQFVRDHLYELESAPSAFLSVSATAASRDAESQTHAQNRIDEFMGETGWRPNATLAVGGALAYTKYPWFLRMMLKSMVKRMAGEHRGDTDASRDYEYTDWEELGKFVADFARANASRPSAMLL